MSAEDALRHSYFRSLGDQVQTLADSEYKRYSMSNIQGASVSSPPFLSSAASIFSVKGIQLQKDLGKRSSMYPESGKSSKEGKHMYRGNIRSLLREIESIAFFPARSLFSLFDCYMLLCGHATLVSKYGLFRTSGEYSLINKHNCVLLNTKFCLSLTSFVISRLRPHLPFFPALALFTITRLFSSSCFCHKYSSFL